MDHSYGAAFVCTISRVGVCVLLCAWLACSPRAAGADTEIDTDTDTGTDAGARPLFCVLVPHFKDEYWLSVGYGLEDEAKHQNVDLLLFEAGGYRARDTQIAQLETCVQRGAQAILIGAVTSDHTDLIDAVAKVAERVPVYGLVNELHAQALRGRIGVDWSDMGSALGLYLSQLHPAGSAPKTAVLLTGPAEAGWTGPLETGLRDAMAASAVTISQTFGADTGLRPQLALVELALQRYPDMDYLIGSAPAVEAAIGVLSAQPGGPKPVLLATYASYTIKRGLMNGSVLAASFDDPMVQARMAIRQAALRVPPSAQTVGPEIVVLTHADANLSDVSTPPADYFPAIQ